MSKTNLTDESIGKATAALNRKLKALRKMLSLRHAADPDGNRVNLYFNKTTYVFEIEVDQDNDHKDGE